MVIKKTKRLTWLKRFEPQCCLAELYGQRVKVNTVDAAGNHFTQGMAKGLRLWNVTFSVQPCDLSGDSSGGGQ